MANGLVFITSTSFTTQASVSIDNCFSATYTHYIVKRNLLGSAADINIDVRLRVGGVDASAANYRRQLIVVNSTTINAGRATTETNMLRALGYTEATSFGYSELWISNPFETVRTTAWADYANDQDGSIILESGVYEYDPTTSYDGFSAIPASGTITGSISLWGLVKA